MKIKFIAEILVLCLMFFSLASCASPGEPENAENAASTGPQGDQSQKQASETARALPDVPTIDCGGHEFKILTFAEQGNPVHDHPDLTWREENMGEILNDAVYERNMAIEERFNVKIMEIHSTDSANDLRKAVTSQSDMYDLVGQRMVLAYGPITNGYYMNLHALPNLDLAKPWYIQSSVENLTVGGKLFTVYSEMLVSPYCAAAAIVFNKKLHSEHGLPDPYQMVRDGEWTIDALYDMCKVGSKDLNGDGAMTYEDDQWGFMTPTDAMAGFLFGGGGSMGSFQSDGSFEFRLASEKSVSILDKAFQILYDKNLTINMHAVNHGKSSINTAMDIMWIDGRAAFAWTRIGNIRLWREMDIPFGILPMPKYDAAQEKYCSVITPWQAMGTCIPVTATDIDRTTIILEAISAESRYTLQPAYFEVTLKMKQARDEESAEMLEYIFGNTVIDAAMTYNFGGMAEGFLNLGWAYNPNIQSFYEKCLPSAERDIEKLIEFIGNLDN